MADWSSLEIEKLKSGVRSVFVPPSLLATALKETGCENLAGGCFHKVRDWLIEQIGQNLAVPVIHQTGLTFFKPEDGGARLIFLSR